MPQMAPLLWLNLFVFFLSSLILFLMINFFIKPFCKMNMPKKLLNYPEKSWKW